MRRIFGWLGAVVMMGVILAGPVRAADFGGYQTAAKALALYNLGEEKLLAEENADAKLPIASLTKLMTALVVIEDRKLALTDTVKITAPMLANLSGWSVAGFKVGMQVSVEELLYGLMLPSGGDAGQALAIAEAGSVEAFAGAMNRKAAEIGLADTHYSNQIGRDEDNYSTAKDVAKLLIYALKNEKFKEIFDAKSYDAPALGKKIYKTTTTYGVDVSVIEGSKTGFTYAAGRCLASTAKANGVEYLLVVLGEASSPRHLTDSLAVYDYYGKNYGYREVLAEGRLVASIPVVDSATETYEVRVPEEFRYFLKNDYDLAGLMVRLESLERIDRGVGLGDEVASLVIEKDGERIYERSFRMEELPEFNDWAPLIAGILVGGVALGGVLLVVLRKERLVKWVVVGVVVAAGVAAAAVIAVLKLVPAEKVMVPGELKLSGVASVEEVTVAETKPVESVPVASNSSSTTSSSAASGNAGTSNTGTNCTLGWGPLMLINPNYTVTTSWIGKRKANLIDLTANYGILEGNANNGRPMMDVEAGKHLAEMLKDYAVEYPGHSMTTRSCFRAKGTTCGRLCYATGTSDHHTGYTCDLIDSSYGNSLNTADLGRHVEWQWLRKNSWKYGFIDRFPESWAGGPMSKPVNVNAEGTTGLYEAWHYRYVGLTAAKEIAQGKYNNGKYDSLEHYLKASGKITNLLVKTGCR